MYQKHSLAAAAIAMVCAHAAPAADTAPTQGHEEITVTADVVAPDGKVLGFAALSDTPQGVVLQVNMSGLAPGKHGFHFHETGRCEQPSFKSAGGHFNPTDASHGYLRDGGHHAGDMPNQVVPGDGRLMVSLHNPAVRLHHGAAALIDDDGGALIIHNGADDYSSQPSGSAGERIACAAFTRDLLHAALRLQDAGEDRPMANAGNREERRDD